MSVRTIDEARERAMHTCDALQYAAQQQRDYFLSLLPAHTGDAVVSERTPPQDDDALRAMHVKAMQMRIDIDVLATRQERATLKLLPHYSDYGDKLPKKATSRLYVSPVPADGALDWKEEGSMWRLYSEGLTAKPLNTFVVGDVLRWIKKQPDIDWGVLITPEDREVLAKYGFDKEGLRRVRNRVIGSITEGGEYVFEPLDVIANLLPPAIAAQIDFASLEKRFVGRWLLRMQKAKEEDLYKTSAPHKRRLEELEEEAKQLREKRPKLFD